MSPKKLDFRVTSRKPFDAEAPIIEAVKNAQSQIAAVRGVVQGTALFKIRSHATATGTLIPQAVDIVRSGVEQAVARNNAAAQEIQTSVQRMIDSQDSAARQVRAHGNQLNAVQRDVRSGIQDAEREIAASLARLNA